MSAHTPLPWLSGGIYIVSEANETLVARTHYGAATPFVDAIANAEFIVHAVNCHGRMIEQLEAILADASAYHWHTAIRNTLANVASK